MSTSLPMKKRLPALVQTSGGAGGLVVVFLPCFGWLNDMERQAVERFRGDLGAGILGLLARPLENFLEFLLVLTRVGDQHAGRRQLGIVATDRGDRQGSLGDLDQLFDADADPFLECLGRHLRAARASSSRKSLRPGSFQSWPY